MRLDASSAVAGLAILALGACDREAPSVAGKSAVTTPVSGTEQRQQTRKVVPPSRQNNDPIVAVEGEGLRLFNPTTSAATPIAFGRSQTDVLKALERLRGAASKGTNQDCGAGSVDYATWSDGLSLVFQRNRFVGWGIDRRAAGTLTTASGVGPGSTRQQLDAAYGDVSVRQSSLGTEFAAGGFSGVIDGTKASSKITDMWAGTNCVAR